MPIDTTVLLTYGPLGLWTAVLLYDKYNSLNNMRRTIDNNTVATNKLSSLIEFLKKEKS